MATSYLGLYKYPLSASASYVYMLFRTDHATTEPNYNVLIRQEIEALVASMPAIQGTVLSVRRNNENYGCSATFYSDKTGLYTFPRGPADMPEYYANFTESTSGASNLYPAPGTGYMTAFYLRFYTISADGKYLEALIHKSVISQYPEDNLRIGVSAPAGSSPGFVVFDQPSGLVITSPTAATTAVGIALAAYLEQTAPTPWIEPDPYTPGGIAEPSGPNTGSWTLINTDVDFPDLPEITASDTGFFSIWVPTLEQIQLLAGFMWNTDPLNIDFWKNMVASPLDLILGLSLFPIELDVDGHESLTLGLVDTRIDTNYRNAQFVDVDCGELDLEEYYGAFLDYAPFTQLDIYLPYIGVRTINTNDVMPKRLHLRYRIDLVSGSCVAMLKADNSVYYHWNGACSVAIPVTTNQMRDLVQGVVSAAGAVASGILTGGISGALAATSGVASAAVNSSQHAGRSGTMGSAAGFLGVQTPYLIITRPRQAIPENQNHYTGYPTFITAKLGDLLGYTEVEAVHLHGIPATSDELDEIERLLGEGVIL